MKILYVLDFFYPHVGGVPTLFYNLARGMVKKGHSVTVITTRADGRKNFETVDGIKIYRLGKRRERFMAKATMKLVHSGEKFDVIHTSTYSAMIPSFFFSLFRNVPKILSVHEVWSLKEWREFTKKKGLFYFLEERLLFKLPFTSYVVPSQHTKKDLEGIGVSADKIKVVPHGIDTAVFNPTKKKYRKEFRSKHMLGDGVIGIFVGKPTVFKGVDYLLTALESVMRKRRIKFLFLLSRSHASGYNAFLRRIASSKILRENVLLLEPTPDPNFVAEAVASSDFLVMPSITEGFGFAAAEAASMGIPTIVTKGNSLEEIIENGKHGLHVGPRDSRSLAKAIEKLASDSGLRKKLSAGKKFSAWQKIVKDYESIYEDIIHNHKAGH